MSQDRVEALMDSLGNAPLERYASHTPPDDCTFCNPMAGREPGKICIGCSQYIKDFR